ncbi:hypothetical protein ACFFRR_009920 [Megaselia abdita]
MRSAHKVLLLVNVAAQYCFGFPGRISYDWQKSKFKNIFYHPAESSYLFQNPNGPETYAFGYEIKSSLNNNVQFREEEKFGNGTIQGSHGYARPDGYVSITYYTADESGFHSAVESFMDPNFSSIIKTEVDKGKATTHAPSIITTDYGLMEGRDTISQSIKDSIYNQHGIDIDDASSTEGIKNLHPKIASVINGEVSLTSKNTDDIQGEQKIGFFIPDSFHLSAFELPTNKTN